MTNEDILDALGRIDGAAVWDAGSYRRPPARRWKWGAAAACACLILAGGLLLIRRAAPALREIDLSAGDIAELSSAYHGTLLVDRLALEDADAASGKLLYAGTGSGYEDSDWEALSVSADYADYTVAMNCSFRGAPAPADGLEQVDTVRYGDIAVTLYRAAPTEEFAYRYTAIFEYDGVYYDLSTQSNEPGRIYGLIAATAGAASAGDPTASGLPEGAEPFTDILGFDGYRVSAEESTPNFFLWHYYAELDGEQVCIAEQFGYLVPGVEPASYRADLDGDGVSELICNVVYGTSAERVIVYRNRGGVIEAGTIDPDFAVGAFGAEAWMDGSNAVSERYDPVEGTFVVTKTASGGSTRTVSFRGLEHFIFSPRELHGTDGD